MPYFKDPVPVPDHIACFGPKQFVLLGRPSHLINIAGRRVSLDELNGQLQEIPGVEDGTFFMPDEHEAAGCVTRLVAFVVAPDKTNLEILEELRNKIDTIFLPRPLFLVQNLPRNSTGKLTRASLCELFIHVSNPGKEKAAD